MTGIQFGRNSCRICVHMKECVSAELLIEWPERSLRSGRGGGFLRAESEVHDGRQANRCDSPFTWSGGLRVAQSRYIHSHVLSPTLSPSRSSARIETHVRTPNYTAFGGLFQLSRLSRHPSIPRPPLNLSASPPSQQSGVLFKTVRLGECPVALSFVTRVFVLLRLLTVNPSCKARCWHQIRRYL